MANAVPHLSSLLANTSLHNHEEILKAANETLKKTKTDVHAQRIRAIALLQLDRYDDALKAFEEAGQSLQKDAQLEYAYALYKCGKLEQAAKIAGHGPNSNPLKHVEAQAAYKLEQFPRARKLYDELSRLAGQDSESDLRINQGAADAQLSWSGATHMLETTKAGREDMEQFETAYNAACGYIARGDLKGALMLLTKARDLCNALDDLSEDEKQAELLPISVQRIYVLAQLGQLEEAQHLCSTISPTEISDPATRHVAQANILCLSAQAQNPFLSHRHFHETSRIPARDRPFQFQASALTRNGLVLEQQVGKTPTPRISQVDGETLFPNANDASIGVLTAAAQARGQIGSAAIREILPHLERNPANLGLLVTVIHLYLLTDNAQAAATLLDKYLSRLEQSDPAIRYTPGLVSLQISLSSSLHRNAHTKAELAKALAFWRHKSKPEHNLAPLFTTAATDMLESPSQESIEGARDLFELIRSQDANSKVITAGLAATTSENDADSSRLDRDLPSIAELTTGIDVGALEAAGIAKPPTQAQSTTKAKRPAEDTTSKPSKPHKIRKSHTIKDFDPNKKMDPERWLPLRDRTYYRPKGKKKNKAAAAMATQGGVVSEESRPVTPSQVHQAPKQAGNKKKKGKK